MEGIRPRCGCETGAGLAGGLLLLLAARRELLHLGLVLLQAAGADIGPRALAAQEDANPLEVRIEAALGSHHRMAPVVTEARLLPANCADLGHRPSSVATAPRRGAVRRRRPSRAQCAQLRRPSTPAPGPARPRPRSARRTPPARPFRGLRAAGRWRPPTR